MPIAPKAACESITRKWELKQKLGLESFLQQYIRNSFLVSKLYSVRADPAFRNYWRCEFINSFRTIITNANLSLAQTKGLLTILFIELLCMGDTHLPFGDRLLAITVGVIFGVYVQWKPRVVSPTLYIYLFKATRRSACVRR